MDLPAELQLRLLGRAIACVGNEGPVQLAKLEALQAALAASSARGTRLRRTLAGAMITRAGGHLTVERAPARGRKTLAHRHGKTLNHRATSPPQTGPTALE